MMLKMVQLFVSGLTAGSVYALVAVGFVMIYKATNVVNFGQGFIVMMGAYVAYIFYKLGFPMIAVFLFTIGTLSLFGIALDRIVIRWIYKAPIMTIIIATFAVGIILQCLFRLRYSDDVYSLPSVFSRNPINIKGLLITPQNLWILVITIVIMVILTLLFKFTKIGKAMRATSQSQDAASLMGISVKKIFSITWAIGCCLGGLGGVLLAPLVGVTPETSFIGIKAFITAVIGGFTSLPGAVIGGFLIGVVETFAGAYISTAFKDAAAFIILIGVLLIKPTGLFPEKFQKRV